MFNTHHIKLNEKISLVLHEYATLNNLPKFNQQNMNQATLTFDKMVAEMLYFGFDIWPKET